MNKKDLLVSLDSETTGLDAGFHEIVSLSCIAVDWDFKKVTEFHIKIRPTHFNRIDPEALKVNGYTEDQLRNDPSFINSNTARGLFNVWSQNGIQGRIHVLAQNWPFDKAFTELWLGKMGFDEAFHYHYEDTKSTALFLQRSGFLPLDLSTSLTSLCDYFDIPHDAHKAKGDALANLHVYKAMLNLVRELRSYCDARDAIDRQSKL